MSIITIKELFKKLEINESKAALALRAKASKNFSMQVPDSFIKKMQKGNLADPLLREILPSVEELKTAPGFTLDPLLEKKAYVTPKLLHKYKGRVLLVVTAKCALHCRFCFRKNLLNNSKQSATDLSDHELKAALAYIANDKSIHEVILSGGEPLLLSKNKLQHILLELQKIAHLKRVRIHTRLPIVCPQLITDDLIKTLTKTRFSPIIVLHCNHPAEIDNKTSQALKKMRAANLLLLNQSVLLKGVNDSVTTLMALSESLIAAEVIPYYLHLLDTVSGAEHFMVSRAQAKKLHRALQNSLSGYLVPRLVYEKAGAGAKVAVG